MVEKSSKGTTKRAQGGRKRKGRPQLVVAGKQLIRVDQLAPAEQPAGQAEAPSVTRKYHYNIEESFSHKVDRVLSFFQVVGIGTPPPPHPQTRVYPPPPPVSRGRDTLACGRGVGGVPFPTIGDIHCGILYMCMYFMVNSLV